MIDNVYYYEQQNKMPKRVSDGEKAPDIGRPEWFSANPAVRALLDHLAEELAKEYIGLMQAVASKPGEPGA
jgi:hypothetical protein